MPYYPPQPVREAEGVARIDPIENKWYLDNAPLGMILRHGKRYYIAEIDSPDDSPRSPSA